MDVPTGIVNSFIRSVMRERLTAYSAFGFAGVLCAVSVVVVLAGLRMAPITLVLIVVVAPLLWFLFGVKLAHILAGAERLVLYEQSLIVLSGTALTLHCFGQSIWQGLELATIGLGVFLAVARLGCLSAGCCHGRPFRQGIAYGEAHRRDGFPACYVGVSLFPVQAVEALAHAILAGVAAVVYLSPHIPGEVSALYVSVYALMRFFLELVRGDTARPYLLGSSESQWIAVASSWSIAGVGMIEPLSLASFYLSIGSAAHSRDARSLSDRGPHLGATVAVTSSSGYRGVGRCAVLAHITGYTAHRHGQHASRSLSILLRPSDQWTLGCSLCRVLAARSAKRA